MKKIIILGGGASGLLASILLSREASVTLIESNKNVGEKLGITGNGRCNLTNSNFNDLKLLYKNSDFVRNVLDVFDNRELLRLFDTLQMPTINHDGYYYPYSENARNLVALFRNAAINNNVKIKCNANILNIEKNKETFKLYERDYTYEGDYLILACGSNAGIKDDGKLEPVIKFISKNHKFIPFEPALVGLNTMDVNILKLAGIRMRAKVNYKNYEDIGEIQFSKEGISGIPIMNLSMYMGEDISIEIDLLPDMDYDELISILKGYSNLKLNLLAYFDPKLIAYLLEALKQKEDSDKYLFKLANKIKHFKITGLTKRSILKAQVGNGGVSVSDINCESFESKYVSRLYIIGELLDVIGRCGGYNLQFAFSSAAICANKINNELGIAN